LGFEMNEHGVFAAASHMSAPTNPKGDKENKKT
jgi:hypothetical protein